MSVWVVVGGQYGSEGKGKIAARLTLDESIDFCVRTGGPNSGHSFVDNSGCTHTVRQIPTGFIRPHARLLIPAGGVLDLRVLKYEIESLRLDPMRLGIDSSAMIIEEEDRAREATLGLRDRLSSTLCGVGSAVARRVMRGNDVRLAKHAAQGSDIWLKPFLTDVLAEVNSAIDRGRKVLLEGTQGFGLSLLHGNAYPKATSRDTTAAAVLSEVGLSPRLVAEIVLVLRTYPIRVAGDQAGPLFRETSWEDIQRESGCPHDITEFTTVTAMKRRVGHFDWKLLSRAVEANRPTRIAINGLDYIDYQNRHSVEVSQLSARTVDFLARLSQSAPVCYLGASPRLDRIIRTRLEPTHYSVGEQEHAATH